MFFLPYKLDLCLKKIPFLTIIVMLICLVIYIKQANNEQDFVQKTDQFCMAKRTNFERMVLKKALGDSSPQRCVALMNELSTADDPQKHIAAYSEKSERIAGYTPQDSHDYMQRFLNKEYSRYRDAVPPLTTQQLWYSPHTWDPVTMLTSNFAHGSWDHILGNLLYFFIFGAAVELIIGSAAYFVVILVLSFGTSLSYSIAMMNVTDALPTVGLSGVVMGMIAMLSYFMPSSKILCFYWFLIKIGVVGVSTWILALLYIGIDTYTLITVEEMGGINLVAHVSGAAIGFLLALALFRRHKARISVEYDIY
ncbi:MAG: rhomboid family intramembrane serine protease [Candidatus Thiodiazotropha sp.]